MSFMYDVAAISFCRDDFGPNQNLS